MAITLQATALIKRRDADFKIADSDHLKALRQSVISHGQTQNIKVRELAAPTAAGELYEIVDGLKLFNILKSLGYREVYVYNFGVMDDITALKTYVQHNICSFERNDLKLSELARELNKVYSPASMVNFTPFGLEQVKNLIKLLDFDWDSFKAIDDTAQQQTSLF